MDYDLPKRFEESNKSTYGRVLNFAGSDYMSGAAYLSSVSALKIGAGYCFLSSTDRVIDSVSAKTSCVVFLPYDEAIKKINQFDVISIGCGLGQSEQSQKIFNQVIANLSPDKNLVIDADGINLLAHNKEFFIQKGFNKVILTPHPKEASRLLDISVDEVLTNTMSSAKKISEIYKCVTVLKTHKTCVVTNEKSYINSTGNNAMAKAGSGDVLTGMISGLVAQKMDLYEASCLAVYLHGQSGDIAKEELTEYSVLPEDLISFLPKSIKLYKN